MANTIESYSPGQGSIEVGLDDWDPTHGFLRSELEEEVGQQTKKAHRYKVRYLIKHEVHGTWKTEEGGPTDDASLIVLKIVPDAGKAGWTFRSLEVTLALDRIGSDEGELYFAAFEPAQDGALKVDSEELEVTDTTTNELSLKGAAPGGVVAGEGKTSRARSVKSTVKKMHKVEAGFGRSNPRAGPKTRVFWRLTAIQEAVGVGDTFTVAFVVRRAPGRQFTIRADTTGKLGGVWDRLPGGRKEIELTPFGNKNNGKNAKLDGVDENNLHKTCEGKSEPLRALVGSGVHVPELALPLSHYPAPATTPSNDGQQPDKSTGTSTAQKTETKTEPRTEVKTVEVKTEAGTQLGNVASTAEHAEPLEPLEALRVTLPQPHRAQRETPREAPKRRRASTVVRNAANAGPSLGPLGDSAVRHRKMAALYGLLAQLHREEADDALARAEASYAAELESWLNAVSGGT